MSGTIDRQPPAYDADRTMQGVERIAETQLDAHQRQQAARAAIDYHGTTFGYGTGVGPSWVTATQVRHVQQMMAALARRRRPARRGAGDASGDANTDEPNGIDHTDVEADAPADQRRDAGYETPAEDPVRVAGRALRMRLRKRRSGHASADVADDDDDDAPHGDAGDIARLEAPDDHAAIEDAVLHARGGTPDGQSPPWAAHDSARADAGPAGAAAQARRRKRAPMRHGIAIAPDPSEPGPLERLAAALPHDALRDRKLRDAHFDRLWSACQRALAEPGVSFAEQVHALALDWHLAQRKHGAPRAEGPAVLRDRLVDASRRRAAGPASAAAADPRRAAIHALVFLLALAAEAPCTPARRDAAIRTRRVLLRMSRTIRARRAATE